MSELMEKIAASKRAIRAELADLPIDEKIKILEQLRDRSVAIAQARPVDADSKPSLPKS